MNAQELRTTLIGSSAGRLRFQRGEKSLEPLKGGSILTDPDELDTTQSAGRIRAGSQVPDILEDRGPWCDADAGSDEDGDFVFEDVFGGCTIWPVDAEFRHHLPVLEGDFVHAHWVEGFEVFRLCGTASQCVCKGASEVTYLADVDADVGVEGAGGDGEWVPLGTGHVWDLDKEPLACFVFHAWFVELDFYGSYFQELAANDLGRGWFDTPYG